MNFNFLYDEHKTLSPFFSPIVLTMTFNSVWMLACISLVSWPFRSLPSYLSSQTVPLAFLVTFGGSLLINAYMAMLTGRGDVHSKDYFSRLGRQGLITHEENNDFITYGLPVFVLNILWLFFLSLPLVITAAAASAVSLAVFFKGVSIILSASLLIRLFSFLNYLVFGIFSSVGQFIARVFYAAFMFSTWFFVPSLNPFWQIYNLYIGKKALATSSMTAYLFYLAVVGLVCMFLILAIQSAIWWKKKRRSQKAAERTNNKD